MRKLKLRRKRREVSIGVDSTILCPQVILKPGRTDVTRIVYVPEHNLIAVSIMDDWSIRIYNDDKKANLFASFVSTKESSDT